MSFLVRFIQVVLDKGPLNGFSLLPPPRRICNRHCVCLYVCLLVTLRKNFQVDLYEIFREGRQWANEQVIKFWWRSSSWIEIATLVRHALAEVCTVTLLVVIVTQHRHDVYLGRMLTKVMGLFS